jgi:hypothetical protein
MLRAALFSAAFVLVSAGCAGTATYTSQDLALLPCEVDVPRFFQPLEFDADGRMVLADQEARLAERLARQPQDVLIFIHGWNKTAFVAEREYQDFLCRFHGRLREAEGRGAVRPDRILIIGVFWPSTLDARRPDPFIAKWITYFPVRQRADRLAGTGFVALMKQLTAAFSARAAGATRPRLHLVGHSFGGRVIVKGMRAFIREKGGDPTPAHDLVRAVERLNFVMLNAAVGREDFNPLEAFADREKVAQTQQQREELLSVVQKQQAPVTAATAATIYSGFTFNVYSEHDVANKYLFPLASLFTDDDARCAIGACGLGDNYKVIKVTPAGHLSEKPETTLQPGQRVAWNIDASTIVFDHSDIYKGRVATVLFELLHESAALRR